MTKRNPSPAKNDGHACAARRASTLRIRSLTFVVVGVYLLFALNGLWVYWKIGWRGDNTLFPGHDDALFRLSVELTIDYAWIACNVIGVALFVWCVIRGNTRQRLAVLLPGALMCGIVYWIFVVWQPLKL